MESVTSNAIFRLQSSYTGVISMSFPISDQRSLYIASPNMAIGYVGCGGDSFVLSGSPWPGFWSCNNNRGFHYGGSIQCNSMWDYSLRPVASGLHLFSVIISFVIHVFAFYFMRQVCRSTNGMASWFRTVLWGVIF